MKTHAGKTALVTGASSGLGQTFARTLAARGATLVVVARRGDRLEKLAADLTAAHGVRVEPIVADLTREGAAQAVYQEAQKRDLKVDLLVNNAGFSTYGYFDTIAPAREREMILLNSVAVSDMCHAFIPDMLARRSGGVINVASLVGLLPLPYQAAYAATKAFVIHLSAALWSQYRSEGVRVLAVCPGSMGSTGFYEVMASGGMNRKHKDTPENVTEVALDALERGKSYVIPGKVNYLTTNVMTRLLPRSMVAMMIEKKFREPRAAPPAGRAQ
jgi:short-subunit dehydrogenase